MVSSRSQIQHKQKGAALVTMLLIFSLIVILISYGSKQLYNLIKISQHNIESAQARQYALAGEAYGIEILHADLTNKESRTDHLNEDWNIHRKPFKPEKGSILISIIDLQSRININNLITPDGNANTRKREVLSRLFQNLNINSSNIDNIIDWLDSDQTPQGINSEDRYYTTQPIPYLTANTRIQDVGELFAINGISYEDIAILEQYITALPTTTKININTAPAPVLSSLSPTLNGASIVQKRATLSEGFTSTTSFLQSSVTAGSIIDAEAITDSSSYFLIVSETRFQGTALTLATKVMKNREKKKIQILGRTIFHTLNYDLRTD